MNQVKLLAEITAKPGKETELAAALQALVEPSRHDEGCLQYNLYQDDAQGGLFVMDEIWASREALQLHEQTEHFQAFVHLTQQEQLLESLNLRFLTALA